MIPTLELITAKHWWLLPIAIDMGLCCCKCLNGFLSIDYCKRLCPLRKHPVLLRPVPLFRNWCPAALSSTEVCREGLQQMVANDQNGTPGPTAQCDCRRGCRANSSAPSSEWSVSVLARTHFGFVFRTFCYQWHTPSSFCHRCLLEIVWESWRVSVENSAGNSVAFSTWHSVRCSMVNSAWCLRWPSSSASMKCSRRVMMQLG